MAWQLVGLPCQKSLLWWYLGLSKVSVSPLILCRDWNEKLLQDACRLLAGEMDLSASAPGGMVDFRRTLTLSFFFKFYLTVLQKLSKNHNGNVSAAREGRFGERDPVRAFLVGKACMGGIQIQAESYLITNNSNSCQSYSTPYLHNSD